MATKLQNTSGQHHPYWYESFVGLIEVVKLLNPDEKVVSVTFQSSTIKGWDDVVVELENGRRLYQVKHTREGDSLTFGDLVSQDAVNKSLLRELFDGWRESGLNAANTELVLYTNRRDGTNWYKQRPPLLKFWQWMKAATASAKSLADVVPESGFADGWEEWRGSFLGCSDSDVLAFLRQFQLRTREDDLDGLELRICQQLSASFGLSVEQVSPLFDALCRELKRWTTGFAGVDAEILCNAIAVSHKRESIYIAPPPPEPFFPTRVPIASELEGRISEQEGAPIVFLTGEPGSGKTSLVSWLANRRNERPLEGAIGVRFYCFEPIRPENPIISPDASRVKPEELWHSLLIQLLEGLRNRLHELEVPLVPSYLTWQEARVHVLRIADILGKEHNGRFVISIDGIDHAARASQFQPTQIREFFKSLPKPEEVRDTAVRIMIAGQPPENFIEQYPAWLVSENELIERIDLPILEGTDVLALVQNSDISIPSDNAAEIVRVIEHHAKGNTLAVVFAVKEAESVSSISELESRLTSRKLASGITEYYDAIWKHAIRERPQLDCSLSAAISLARVPITPEQLADSFKDFEIGPRWWLETLRNLGPLLIEHEGAFQIRHNDIRVFLAAKYQGHTPIRRVDAASALSDHFLSPDCNRVGAHTQLFDLLRLANRASELASVFDVGWVFEGLTLGFDSNKLARDGEEAAFQLSASREWNNVIRVACGLQTVERIQHHEGMYDDPEPVRPLPPFLPSEAFVVPLSAWTRSDFESFVWDVDKLLDHGEASRASGLFQRWLSGMTINDIVQSLPDIVSTGPGARIDDEDRLDDMVKNSFTVLGRICARLRVGIEFDSDRKSESLDTEAFAAFDEGFISEQTSSLAEATIDELFEVRQPSFLRSWEELTDACAAARNWITVVQLLVRLKKHRDDLSPDFLAKATYYARFLENGDEADLWTAPLSEHDYGLADVGGSGRGYEYDYEPCLLAARATGWTRIGFAPADIADSFLKHLEYSSEEENSASTKLLVQTAAVLGRIEKELSDGDAKSAAATFSPQYLAQLVDALWDKVIPNSRPGFSGHKIAAELADELCQYCEQIGGDHKSAIVEVASTLLEKRVLGDQMKAVWRLLLNEGKTPDLRQWVEHYLGEDGFVWSWENHATRQTVAELAPLAREVGLDDLASRAESRAKFLLIEYQDRKEYSFEEAMLWFQEAAIAAPEVWETHGWQLWQLCAICEERHHEHELATPIRNSISAAAIRLGAPSWWRLIATTEGRCVTRRWHLQTREQVVQGVHTALKLGATFESEDICSILSIAVALTYWFEPSETDEVAHLREAMLQQLPTSEHASLVSRINCNSWVATDREPSNAKQDESPATSSHKSDDVYWAELDTCVAETRDHEWRTQYAADLFRIARARAQGHGTTAVQSGLAEIIRMHAKWTFGEQANWNSLHLDEEDISWAGVAVNLTRILLRSYSSEVIRAALEGMHHLVDSQPAVIPELFDTLTEPWARRWFLNSSERWAVLHPSEIESIAPTLVRDMTQNDLACRLQAWVTLARNCDNRGCDRIEFPLPDVAATSFDDVSSSDDRLLDIPPEQHGRAFYANRFSAARSLLRYCEFFGFQFDALQGLIASKLRENARRVATEQKPNERGPRRWDDFFCTPPEAEIATGDAILEILDARWMDNEKVGELAQAFLSVEDPWLCAIHPKPMDDPSHWFSDCEYQDGDTPVSEMESRCMHTATKESVPPNWTVASARIYDYSWKDDYELCYWLEEFSDSLVIESSSVTTCPGGRLFPWWIGEPMVLATDKYVSGLFVGGRQRLSHAQLEIRPPLTWRTKLGWSPDPENPLVWRRDDEVVAMYDQRHGTLRDNRGHNYRQPVMSRWLVADSAYDQMTETFGELISRHTFQHHKFKDT
ncbi:MAG: ATP-binding protein [Planctomycetota bacterium]